MRDKIKNYYKSDYIGCIREVMPDLKASELKDDVCFKDLGFDSLDFIELIMCIEKEFDIQIPDAEAENIKTVGEGFERLIFLLS